MNLQMCFNRADGKLLWQSGVVYSEKEQTQASNPWQGSARRRSRSV
jgi:hypothetical protein